VTTIIRAALSIVTALAIAAGAGSAPASTLPAIPSLWDTAWILPLADRETIDAYLTTRRAQGFEAVLVGVTDWAMRNVPLGNGHKLFLADRYCDARGCYADLTRPNDLGFDYLDALIAKAGSLGLVVAFLPMSNGGSADYVRVLEDASSGEQRALRYGRYLGERYKESPHLIWVLGGDVCPEAGVTAAYPTMVPLTRALAQGILEGGARQPMTFHAGAIVTRPWSCAGSSRWFDGDGWLTFHMVQVGGGYPELVAPSVRADYLRTAKQTGLGEGGYEREAPSGGWLPPAGVRSAAYRTYLAGGSYYAYGKSGSCCGGPYTDLQTAGAAQVRLARDLMVQRRWQDYVPDESFVSASTGDTVAAIAGRSAAMVYLAGAASRVEIAMARLDAQPAVRVQRFNPADGARTVLGTFPAAGTQWFDTGGLPDAVILLDAVP
jgi:hypothetical protein